MTLAELAAECERVIACPTTTEVLLCVPMMSEPRGMKSRLFGRSGPLGEVVGWNSETKIAVGYWPAKKVLKLVRAELKRENCESVVDDAAYWEGAVELLRTRPELAAYLAGESLRPETLARREAWIAGFAFATVVTPSDVDDVIEAMRLIRANATQQEDRLMLGRVRPDESHRRLEK